ncbi:hypothetical protein GmHk_08G021283 [Glycine max]|nr:hypothetical protein GmHk_08G021283 [Glycine max]
MTFGCFNKDEVEAANKNFKIIQKMVVTFALHGYHTSIRISICATPFSLVYGIEAVLPIEVEIPSLRVLMEAKLEEAKWVQSEFEKLNLIKEERLNAICHDQLYQKRLKKAFERKVHPREFQVEDSVLKKILLNKKDKLGKWTPNYEGSYAVKKKFSGGAFILTNMDGKELSYRVNFDAVKKFYA